MDDNLLFLGFSVRAVLGRYAANDPTQFRAVKVRFTKPVIPGHTLAVHMWKNGQRIHFESRVKETGERAITGMLYYFFLITV